MATGNSDIRCKWYDPLVGYFLRIAACGWVPPSWFRGALPIDVRRARTGRLHIEIVSHCWQYAHFLAYQLSSLVLYPPQNADVTMTVYYNREDEGTSALLDFFGSREVPGITWNWRELPRNALFRRAIGRNEAALATRADWVWFTDCDLLFRQGCLDGLAESLQGRRDALVFPATELITTLLDDDDPMLHNFDPQKLQVIDIDDSRFVVQKRDRATGPLQIAHGDVTRVVGYCDSLGYYQTPAEKWCKAHEDRAFRWLLGSRGTGLDIPGVYRIRHVSKGRYTGSRFSTRVRSKLRKVTSPH